LRNRRTETDHHQKACNNEENSRVFHGTPPITSDSADAPRQ
jgi:hypothetical protein